MNLFYPSHDIALANGVRHFNPPVAALRLQEDLASLSDIWNAPFLEGKTSIPLPWGWDWDTRKYIHDQYGIAYAELPTDDDLERLRALSSRQTMCRLAILMKERCKGQPDVQKQLASYFAQLPVYLDTEEKISAFIDEHDLANIPFVLKTPWSSSGRGLSVSHIKNAEGTLIPTPRDTMKRHALSTLRKMGGIMGENWIADKKADFALLFYASEKSVNFIGYSKFDNDDTNGGITYRQGYLAANETIERSLGLQPAVMRQQISDWENVLAQLLQPFFGRKWHVAYLGIDFVSTHDGSLFPVELNLRCTMGVVCRLWYDQHQEEGIFRISPMLENGHFKADFLTNENV